MKIIKNSLCIATMAVLSFSMVSCENENIDTPASVSEVNGLNTSQVVNEGLVQTKSSKYYPNGRYRIYDRYKNAYYHLLQQTNECSWANYVLAASAIIRGDGDLNYPTNAGGYQNKITHCKNWCGNSHIDSLNAYCSSVDNNAGYDIYSEVVTRSTDLGAAERMLQHLDSYHTPFLYVGSSNRIGHYLIVWTIDWNGTLSGSTVYFTNTLYCASNHGIEYNLSSMSLQSFLNLNVFSAHNMLFLH